MAAFVTGFGRWFPATNFYKFFIELAAHPAGFQQEVAETEITDLAAPEPFHRGNVEILENEEIKAFNQLTRRSNECQYAKGRIYKRGLKRSLSVTKWS